MKVNSDVRKSRFKLPIILLCALALLIGIYFLLKALLPGDPVTPVDPLRYDPIDGEYQLSNNVYNRVDFESLPILYVKVDTGSERFALSRGLDSRFGKQTVFSYWSDYADQASETAYLPDGFFIDYSYDSLYAGVAMGEYYTYPKYLSLLASLAFPAFTERIELSDDPATYAAQLHTYGLDSGYATVNVYGITSVGQNVSHTVKIGKQLLSGKGYYFTVDDRTVEDEQGVSHPVVYATSNTAFSYVFTNPTEYISPRLVAAGLAADGTSAPYQLRDFRTFKNTHVTEIGATVPADASVVVRETTKMPSHLGADGYLASGVTSTVTYDLVKLKANPVYARFAAALTGKTVGDFADPIAVTEITTLGEATTSNNYMRLDLSDESATPKTYTYTVRAVESALSDTDEWTTGTAGDSAVYVKIVYSLAIDGEPEKTKSGDAIERRALLALDSPALTDDQRTTLRTATIGTDLTSPMTVDVTYTKETANQKSVKMYVAGIYFIQSADGKYLPSVTADATYVALRYYTVNAYGEKSAEETIGYDLTTDELGIASALSGKAPGTGLNDLIYTYTEYFQITEAFRVREISAVKSYTTGELKVAFAYQEYSKRDPFYGETYFQNLLPATDKNSVYGMNADICEDLVSILGGVGSSSTSAAGYVGVKTVAVGLTQERMEEYGLYANTVHFTLPRGIYDLDVEGNEYAAVPDMGYLSENEFIFYVSDAFVDPDDGERYRYVGSDMYDLVILVEADDFIYLDYEFEEFFARRTMMTTDVTGIENVRVEMKMEDTYGDFLFNLTHVKFEEGSASEYTKTYVALTVNGDTSFPLLAEYLPANGGLNEFYRLATNGEIVTTKNDYAGDGYFKDALTTVYLTGLEGLLSDAERTAFGATDPVLRITVKLKESVLSHVFEFYRGSDRKVMVRMYTVMPGGAESAKADDFYITTYAYKKIVNAYAALLSAKPVTYDNGYGE